MSSDKTLGRLAALAGDAPAFVDGAQVLDVENALTAILEEIDTAVLPTMLVFDRGDAELKLSVSGRKLHKVLAVSGALDLPDGSVNATLTPEDETALADVAELLTAFANRPGHLHLRRLAADEDSSELSNRVSIASLSRALGLRDPSDTRTAFERFSQEMERFAKATIFLEDGTVSGTQGAIAGISALKIALTTQLSHFLRTRQATCPSHSDPSLTLFADVVEPGMSMAVVVIDRHIALFTVQTGDLFALQRAFRQSL